jgi:hypothetical protein
MLDVLLGGYECTVTMETKPTPTRDKAPQKILKM